MANITIPNVKDGIYYFHVQFQNSSGWGPAAHFKFQIDTQSPEPFSIIFPEGTETDNPRPTISFKTTDALSGIDYYKIKIDNAGFIVIPQDQMINDSYVLPFQRVGPKQILVLALDKSGNYAAAYSELSIASIAPPVVSDYTRTIGDDGFFMVRGSTAFPNSRIIIWLQKQGLDAESRVTTSDSSGNFYFTDNESLKNGAHEMWAQVIDSRGAESNGSDKVVVVVQKSVFAEIKSWMIINLATSCLTLVLIVLLIALVSVNLVRKSRRSK